VFLGLTGRLRGVEPSQLFHSLIVGCLLHGCYLGGVFFAIDGGLAAGISSVVVALQPFVTALIAWAFLRDKLSKTKLVCFATALAGVWLVLFPKVDVAQALPGVTPVTIGACLVATLGISIGTVYQKRYVTSLDLWTSTACQFAGATLLISVLALLFEEGGIVFTQQVVFSLAWLVLVLSIGAVALLMFLIRRNDSASVASLFYLVPVVAMFMGWVLFDETLVAVQLVGSLVVVISVAIASRSA